jgi:hemolysin-activating ACP:hemolysin acyltransferase/GT2 family glycosyltransferase
MTLNSLKLLDESTIYENTTESTIMPLVSVITPVYNGRSHVKDCLLSVVCSAVGGFVPIEHIVIDDGSSDDTVTFIQAIWSNLGIPNPCQCKILQIPHSGKPSHARNCGIKAARGKYIFCLDHDDALLRNALRYLVTHLESTNTEVAYGDFIRSDENLAYVVGNDYTGKNYTNMRAALFSLFKGEHFFQHSLMFTKRLWQEVGGYDENITFGEDFDLCVRYILAGYTPEHIPITTHVHRDHIKSMTAGYSKKTNCPIRMAEHQLHYAKHTDALRQHLSAEQINEIRNLLQITSDVSLGVPLNQTEAKRLIMSKRTMLLKPWNDMQHSLVNLEGKPSDHGIERARILGFICGMARNNQHHAKIPLGNLLGILDSAIRVGQFKLYFNHYGEYMGYVMWAFLAPDVERQMLKGKDTSLHLEEWNQGTSLWVIDFLVPRGSLPYVLRDMRDNLFKDNDTITYFRFKNGRRIAKQLSRSAGGSFFA